MGTAGRVALLLLAALPSLAQPSQPRPHIDEAACERLPIAPPSRRTVEQLPARQEAAFFPVGSVRRIVDKETKDKSQRVKQILAKQRPVLFTLPNPDAGRLIGDLWTPTTDSPAQPAADTCTNAMVVVAYDDATYGGAFEVVRDCGATTYSESAFWMRYGDFDALAACAVELLGGSAPVEDTASLSGRVSFQEATGTTMQARWTGRSYRMQRSYPSRTQFRVTIASNGPAYIYAVGSDLGHAVIPIHPTSGGSAYVAGSERSVILPGAGGFFEMDDTPGTDYVCVLFSARELDLANLIEQLEARKGDLLSRLEGALGQQLVPFSSLQLMEAGEIGFTAQSRTGSVVALMVEIPHS
jgi:hypothetical protein